MNLSTELYVKQAIRWPPGGRHILAHFDAETVVVYQAYGVSIAHYAIANGRFGGQFSYTRMSWIKPNFLWMMYRSGWGRKPDQECTLGLRLKRSFFDHVLAVAVASTLKESAYASHEEWKAALADSEVRLQWDPDHDPHGRPLPRRAIQLGLRGRMLEDFGKSELLEVIDLTEFVNAQRENLLACGPTKLRMPVEQLYFPDDRVIARRLKFD